MSKTRPVLIVTAKLDTHADAVISELKARGQPFFRLNTDDFHTEYRTMLRSGDRSVTFEDIWGRSVRFPHDVHAVWHRKPVESNNPPGVKQRGTADMIQSETLELLNSLSCFHDRPWYNNPENNRVSQRKFPQLCLASELGFRVPRTLITNLVKNAIVHNMPNGWVAVEVMPQGIRVANAAAGKALDAERIFLRFHKETTADAGTGLGLAIAKAIADLYGLRIAYRFSEGHVLEVTEGDVR